MSVANQRASKPLLGLSQVGEFAGVLDVMNVVRVAALGAMALAVVSPHFGWAPALWQPSAVSLAAIVLWATGALPEDQTALAFFVAATLLGVAKPEVIFSGFATDAFWLVFGGLVIGAAVRRSGLDALVCRPILKIARGAYWRAVAAVLGISMALSFLVPSNMTRVILIVPLVLAAVEELGIAATHGKSGLVSAAVLGSYYFGSGILPANVPNMALVGSAERFLGYHFRFADYFLTYFPIFGLLKSAIAGAIIAYAFNVPLLEANARQREPKMSASAWLVAAILGVALILWSTDFAHGISPAWIAMIAALILLFPGTNIIPADQFGMLVNFRPLLFVAGILGLGSFIAATGLGTLVARELSDIAGLRNDGSIHQALTLTGIAAGLGLLATHGGMAALMPSLVHDLSAASGLPTGTVLASIVVGYSILFFPYQVPPSVVGFQMASIPPRTAAVVTFGIGVATSLIAVPLEFLWWRLIGLM